MYVFGSHLFGTNKYNSDIDVIVITTDDYGRCDENILVDNYDLNFYSETKWVDMCVKNHINTLEVSSIPYDSPYIIKHTRDFTVNVDLIKLRQAISAIVSNSWSKANKKLNVKKDFAPFIAKKSLWHCFRMLMFGIQVCEYGRIVIFQKLISCMMKL
jgi:predicted nucleotidyltransferase